MSKGPNPFGTLDRAWERLQGKYRWLYQLDNEDWKTWLAHGFITIVGGHALAWTWLPGEPDVWMRAIYGAYFAREILTRTTFRGWWPIKFDYRDKPLDGFMDFAVPAAAAELMVHFYF